MILTFQLFLDNTTRTQNFRKKNLYDLERKISKEVAVLETRLSKLKQQKQQTDLKEMKVYDVNEEQILQSNQVSIQISQIYKELQKKILKLQQLDINYITK